MPSTSAFGNTRIPTPQPLTNRLDVTKAVGSNGCYVGLIGRNAQVRYVCLCTPVSGPACPFAGESEKVNDVPLTTSLSAAHPSKFRFVMQARDF